ncbi:MAG: hypothetical protein AAF725_17125, partial [Acidobacteriota bacterium]
VAKLLPESPEPVYWLGAAQFRLGFFEEARASLETALGVVLKRDSQRQEISLSLAAALSHLGRSEEALASLRGFQPESAILEFQAGLLRVSIELDLGRHEAGEAELIELLSAFRLPPVSSAEWSDATSKPLLKSGDPATWRPVIQVWLDCCCRHRCLAELGHGLVRSLEVLIRPGISDEAARAWHQTWRELAEGIEELELPLRLFRAGVEFRAGEGPQALLGLAQEERGLLEPMLRTLFATEPDSLDLEMRDLLRTVEARVAELAEERPAESRASA